MGFQERTSSSQAVYNDRNAWHPTLCVRRQIMDRRSQQCAEQLYCPCAGRGRLISQDEAVRRDGALYCVNGLAAPVAEEGLAALSDGDLAALVAAFIRLHAEAKHLNAGLLI